MPAPNTSNIIAGTQIPLITSKISMTAGSQLGLRAVSTWYYTGQPGNSAAPAPGINGEAVTPSSAYINGRVRRNNPGAGQSAYIKDSTFNRIRGGGTISGQSLMIADRLWHNSGLSSTSTSLQSLTPVAMAPRDMNGTSDGVGVVAGLLATTSGGAGTPVMTLTYTNSAGVSGRTTTLTVGGPTGTGNIEFFPLAAGDEGVRSIQSLQLSATRTSGNIHLVLYRIIALIPPSKGSNTLRTEGISMSLPRILDDSVIDLMTVGYDTTFVPVNISYRETHI